MKTTEERRKYFKEYWSKNRKKYLEHARNWRKKNPEKVNESRRQWRLRNPGAELNRSRELLGIKSEAFEKLILLQENKCAICFKPFDLDKNRHLDHCHITGKIRGLLCPQCNLGLGLFKDSQEKLLSAIQYLKLHER